MLLHFELLCLSHYMILQKFMGDCVFLYYAHVTKFILIELGYVATGKWKTFLLTH